MKSRITKLASRAGTLALPSLTWQKKTLNQPLNTFKTSLNTMMSQPNYFEIVAIVVNIFRYDMSGF